MPYNLQAASVASGTVLPKSLSTSFVETRAYPLLTMMYNDGTFERSLIQDGVNPPRALRIWVLAKRLTTAQLSTLQDFWANHAVGGLHPFYFYDPFDVLPGHHMGSNFDPSGDSQQGRATCFFRGDWSQQTPVGGIGINNDPARSGRHVVGNLTLVEVA
jgi:hypothetical protein